MGQTLRAAPSGTGKVDAQPNGPDTLQTTEGRTESGAKLCTSSNQAHFSRHNSCSGRRSETQLNEEDAEDLRGRVYDILRHAKPRKDNLNKEQRKALKELGSLEDEVIQPADKRNATMMMRRDDYDTKMRGILDTATYRQLKKDPTATQGGKLNQRLKRMEKDAEITEGLYHRLRPSGSQPPRIYGLPKQLQMLPRLNGHFMNVLIWFYM